MEIKISNELNEKLFLLNEEVAKALIKISLILPPEPSLIEPITKALENMGIFCERMAIINKEQEGITQWKK